MSALRHEGSLSSGYRFITSEEDATTFSLNCR